MRTEVFAHHSASFSAAFDTLAGAVGALGFDAVDYSFMPQARDPDGRWYAPDIVARNFPPHWQRGWAAFARDDPYLWTCYERNLPLDWNEVKGAGWLSHKQQQAIAYIDGLGFADGLSVPIHLPGGSFAFVSATSRVRANRWRDGQVHDRLLVLAHNFHAAVAHLCTAAARPARAIAISPREHEILRYAAAGYSAPATARAIHRSVETIRHQRKSAMQKLGARTIAQAVGEATARGLLEPSTQLLRKLAQ